MLSLPSTGVGAVLFTLAMTAALPDRPAPRTVPPRVVAAGASYTMRYTSVPSGEGAMASAMAAQRSDWTGETVFAAGRGRIDIVDGNSGVFQKGDWMLFDAADCIIVRPSASHFYRL